MISGALLLKNTLSAEDFIKRRFSKVLFPTLFWTLFYLVVKWEETPVTLSESVKTILSIPFSAQGHGILWFMYTLSGLYLLTPILSKWLSTASKREIESYLLLWGITLVYPYLNQILFINETYTGILYSFGGYAGYYLFGYYLRSFYSYRTIHVIIAVLIIILIPTVLYLKVREFDYYIMLDYLTLPVALMTFCWFVLIDKLPNQPNKFISKVAKVSFGIYLVHIFIMRNLLWRLDMIYELPGMIQIPVVAAATFVLSLMVSWLISRLPFSKYIIGV